MLMKPELPDDSGEESVIEAFAVMGNGQLTVVRVAVRKCYGIDHDTPRGMMPQPVAFFVPTDVEFMVIDSAANLHQLSVGEDAQIRPATIGHLRAVRDVIGRGLGL